ncbi:MAG TPA: M23 family metallopeptidase [Anaeromyxobacteraceae bacterium]|nr:M23 family metallopeptidase [Anaeromyxobacteraceae bacterium]
MATRSLTSTILLGALACGCASAPAVRPDVPMAVKVTPVPAPTSGGTMLAYELYLPRHDALGLRPTRVEIRADGAGGPVLKSYEGGELTRFLEPPKEGWPDVATVLVGVTLPAGQAVPASVHHAVALADGSVATGGAATVGAPALAISPPVRGERWWAANGPSIEPVYHRNAKIPIGPSVYYSERFATDWIQLGPDGLPYRGDGKRNADWYGYGADLLAVADGTIVDARDGVPENTPIGGRDIGMTFENLGGNYVVLDVGDRHDTVAFYAHAIPGSVAVRIGDKVRAGQVLAKLGNSGNSDAPHLHFHLCDGAGPIGKRDESLFCNGLPYVHPSFVLLGRTAPDFGDDGKGWAPAAPPQPRTGEMPVRNQVVSLP